MTGRTGSHQLSGGLYVSGRLENAKERQPTVVSRAVPYTGGDIKNSGELGKMYGVDFSSGGPPGPPPKAPSRASSSSSQLNRSGPNSGPQGPKYSSSGPFTKKSSSSSSFSGPMTPIQPTGLITSGPITSGPLGPNRRSGQLDGPPASRQSSFKKAVYGSAVTSLGEEVKLRFRVSRVAMWVVAVVVVMGLVVGAFLVASVKKPIVLAAVVGFLVVAGVVFMWNYMYRRQGVMRFLRKYPDAELRGAVDGQFVKVTGVVTCGSIPLESSFQKIPRCVYVSTELYQYRGCGGKPANTKHRSFSWGCRHSEKHVTDFYVSDFQSGLRALVKAGYGAKVTPFVKPATVVDISKDNKDLSPNFLSWLAGRGLSTDGCTMRLQEGYIKEGSTVSVMGVVQRHDNVLMIVPPGEPVSTGCFWPCCLVPTYVEGLILTSDENQNSDVIPV